MSADGQRVERCVKRAVNTRPRSPVSCIQRNCEVPSKVELINEYDEDFIAQLAEDNIVSRRNLYIVSISGVIDTAQFDQTGSNAKWKISNVEFAAGIVKAGHGTGLTFNVIGIKGGDLVVHVGSE
ncbi:hypothetical protein N7507_003186 [Penicillium longicatenatum]|nr:hypothetical protein N7507_003186 [Penicillium longicatenatum]